MARVGLGVFPSQMSTMVEKDMKGFKNEEKRIMMRNHRTTEDEHGKLQGEKKQWYEKMTASENLAKSKADQRFGSI